MNPSIFLIPYFIFQISTHKAADVIKDFFNRNYDAAINYVKTGDKSKIFYRADDAISTIDMMLAEKGKSSTIKEIEYNRKKMKEVIDKASIAKIDPYSVVIYAQGDSCRFEFKKEDSEWRVSIVDPYIGIVYHIANYLDEKSNLEFILENEYTKVVSAREIWETDGLPINRQVAEELRGKYLKLWVLELKVRSATSKQEAVSFEVTPLVDENGTEYYPISRYEDVFWKIFNGNVPTDYLITKNSSITRKLPFLYKNNADPSWDKYLLPRHRILKIKGTDIEVRVP